MNKSIEIEENEEENYTAANLKKILNNYGDSIEKAAIRPLNYRIAERRYSRLLAVCVDGEQFSRLRTIL